jgi:spermidine synthase
MSADRSSPRIGLFLKIALFATGCAGIVAEFVLSTLATYLLGNAILQWTVIMSLMLFAMGLGSRMSRHFHKDLLDVFILIEFSLSILCAVSAELAYGILAWTEYTAMIIYAQALIIGSLIGLEIPLVLRLNQDYEKLRINISEVMEKDYYGALVGGFAFAFLALPYLGLTYTPIVLGAINFLVAALLLLGYFSLIAKKVRLGVCFGVTLILLVTVTLLARPVIQYGEQRKYRDKVIYAEQTPYQKIIMTQWKDFHWLYINGQEQFSTYDEEKYHEPLVHPAMALSIFPEHVLILGGGDGLALREVLKYKDVVSVTLVDIDPAMTDLARQHPVLLSVNRESFRDSRVTIINEDAAAFLREDEKLYGVIIVDLPDPDAIDLMQVYSESFYRMIHRHLIKGGIMVTQAGSPYFARQSFQCILKTVKVAGFSVLPYHNQIPTMGEWGWVLGAREKDTTEKALKKRMTAQLFSNIDTRFLNQDAAISMVHFGKGVLDEVLMQEIKINTEINPVLYQYYLKGTWGVY